MSRLMDLGLDQLTKMILDMSRLTEKTIISSLDAYQKKSEVTADSIFQLSNQLGMLKESTNDLAVELLARYQPLAVDLRYIKSCIDISYDLSRFGRYAYDIALTPSWLGDLSSCDFTVSLDMADKALAMIRKSIVAFKNRDAELAKTLSKDDDVIDRMYKEAINSIMNNKDAEMKCVVATLLLVRHLERMADHACYIGDSVVYIVEGQKVNLE
ncbi:MAG: phosphate uptake regulator PhoU [Candidatus Bathyarchaeia archaeon]